MKRLELDVLGFQNRPVLNTFYQQEEGSTSLGLLLPGYRHTLDRALLYYPGRALLERGCDLVKIEYRYDLDPEFQDRSPERRAEQIRTDLTSAYRAAARCGDYQTHFLVGKSLGTLGAAHLVTSESALARAAVLWLTPLLETPGLVEQIRNFQGKSLVAVGTADPLCPVKKAKSLCDQSNCELFLVDGGDHSLEIKGNTLDSVKQLLALMNRFQGFIGDVLQC